MSHIIIAAIMVRYMEDEAAQSRYILQFLPSALKLILEEDIDALLRTVVLYASLSLGEAAVQGSTRRWGEGQVGSGSAGISTFEGIGAVLQVSSINCAIRGRKTDFVSFMLLSGAY